MTNQEIAHFLDATRVQIQTVMDEKFRPVYKSNTWLKQTDLSITERVIMQLVDERNDEFTNQWLTNTTGLSRKCIRENLAKLMERRLIKKVGNTHNYKAISIV
jgi:predicted HTH transcriptional regulator